MPARKFVVYAQNHDQAGNRPGGERFGSLLSLEAQKLAAGAVLLSPFIPLLFMGEEYGETAPFLFFTSHSDAGLDDAVRRGRREEFAEFRWPAGFVDPADPATFERSRPDAGLCAAQPHRRLLGLYTELLRLRRGLPALKELSKRSATATALEEQKTLLVVRASDAGSVFAAFHFGDRPASVALRVPPGNWRRLLDSSDQRWGGPGARSAPEIGVSDGATLDLNAKSFLLYAQSPPDGTSEGEQGESS
ncbi:MAG: DUF3459 domain-containing protein [Elusimicrobiota bacterium]